MMQAPKLILCWITVCVVVNGLTLNRRELLSGVISAGSAVATAPAFALTTSAADVYMPEPGSLTGRTIVVTGGTTGLGLESVERLAVGGASVLLTARTEAKGQAALSKVKSYLKGKGVENNEVRYKIVDLDNLTAMKAIPSEWKDVERIDVLLNNAGVMAIPERELTTDGFERTIQSNHLGHFVLTALLAPKFADDARIINVSSAAYQIASSGLLKGDSLWKPSLDTYGPWAAYGQSKLANILFTEELQRRIQRAGLGWSATCLHPGAVNTDLARYIMGEEKFNKYKRAQEAGEDMSAPDSFLLGIVSSILKDVPHGANTQVWLASKADLNEDIDVRGRYLVDFKVRNLGGAATDKEAAMRLWDESELLSGVKFTV